MKMIRSGFLILLIAIAGIANGQQAQEINLADSTGLPGDNFSLEGALALFKDSKSLEEFEKKINSQDETVNNLDLNNDGKVDYIKIVTAKKDDAHVVILQVPVSKTETQDVAVIEIEKDGDESAFLQILGDEDLYGNTKIVEPIPETEPGDPGASDRGPAAYSHGSFYVHVNVWFWPCIRFMYAPVYTVYISPWYWGYYPVWWSPWNPYPWRYHYMSCWHHHHHYHHVHTHYSHYAHQVYAPRRTTSAIVHNRYNDRVNQYRSTHPVTPRKNNNVNQGRPGQYNQTRPATKPSNTVRPSTQPQGRPSNQPASRPQTKPSEGKPSKPAVKPNPGPRYDQSRPQPKPNKGNGQVKPSNQQSPARPAPGPQSKPSGTSSGSKGNPAKGKR